MVRRVGHVAVVCLVQRVFMEISIGIQLVREGTAVHCGNMRRKVRRTFASLGKWRVVSHISLSAAREEEERGTEISGKTASTQAYIVS